MVTSCDWVDVGNGLGKEFNGNVSSGEVGLIFDGRGRDIVFKTNKQERIEQVINWSKKTMEYPN